MTVNQLLWAPTERCNVCGGFENSENNTKELYVEDRLQASISVLQQLSPSSLEMVISIVRQLAERENIAVPLTASTGLQQPSDGLVLWEADLVTQNYSPNTKFRHIAFLTFVQFEPMS